MGFLNSDGLLYLWNNLKSKLNGKVDKVSGKGLSANDYTTAEKNKLANLENYDDASLKNALTYIIDNDICKNLLDVRNYPGFAASSKISIDDNDVIAFGDIGDFRDWSYSACEYKTNLNAGAYMFIVDVITVADNTDSMFRIYTPDNNFTQLGIKQNSEIGINSMSFTLTEQTEVGFMFKPKNLTCKIMLCKKELYDISNDYVSFELTNKQLTKQIEALTARISALEGGA